MPELGRAGMSGKSRRKCLCGQKDSTLVIILGKKGMERDGNVISFATCYVPGTLLFNPYNNLGTKDCCGLKGLMRGRRL